MRVGYECKCDFVYTDKKMQPSMHRFSRDSQCPTAICADLTKFHLNWKINVEIVGGNSFKPIRNVALSVLIFMKFTDA
jgi:hypothetical protein